MVSLKSEKLQNQAEDPPYWFQDFQNFKLTECAYSARIVLNEVGSGCSYPEICMVGVLYLDVGVRWCSYEEVKPPVPPAIQAQCVYD